MILVNCFRWILGYVRFRASGGFAERFINLCAVNSFDLRDTKITENSISACVNAKDYIKLRPLAKKSGMTLRVVEKKGLYFYLYKHKNRIGLLIGFVIVSCFLSFTSLFVWNVDVVGCENVSKELIAQTISQLGVHEGSFKPWINADEVNSRAMIELSEKVSWLSVNIKGTHATVEVRDFIPKRKDETYKEPCNIVADFDGLILTIEVHNGQKANREGNGVNKGDLLISGIVENRNTSSQFMEARGKITARHNVNIEENYFLKSKCKNYYKAEKRNLLSLFSLKIPLGFFERTKEKFDVYEVKKQLKYADVKLPFAIITETRVYYKDGTLNDENTFLRAQSDFINKSYSNFQNTLLLSSNTKLKVETNSVNIKSENDCIDFMGVKENIF